MKNNPSDPSNDSRADAQLNVVLLSESNLSRSHGIDISTYIQKHYHQQANLACHLWRWNDLENMRCQKATARQSVGADLVIIASDGRRALQESLVAWMRGWNANSRAHRVLVLGCVPEEQRESSTWSENHQTIAEELGGRNTAPLFVTHDGVRTKNADPMIDVPNRHKGLGDEILDLMTVTLATANGPKRQVVSTALQAA